MKSRKKDTKRMSQHSPLISVLLCMYNDEKFIQNSVNSIISQTYKNWEMIIIDDGSQDNTYNIVKQIKDPRIKIYRQKNKGLTRSLNIAANHAKGEFLARQDADDISLPNRFERQIELFQVNPDYYIVGSDLAFINEDGDIVETRTSARNKLQAIQTLSRLSAPFGHGSLMLRKIAFDQINGYDESYPVSQDFDLLLRISQLDGEMGSVPEILYQWRVHPESVTSKKWWVQLIQSLKAHKNVKQILHRTYRRRNFFVFLFTKLFVGFSYILFSPQAFYFYRLAARSYNEVDFSSAQKYFQHANTRSRISLPHGALPLIAKIIKLKHFVN